MTPAIFYFGFHKPKGIREAWRRREWTMFGHVEAWGVMQDGETWFFLDPVASRACLHIEYRCDEVENLLTNRFLACDTVYRIKPPDLSIGIPLHLTMNCVSQCAHLIGARAYGIESFRRILIEHGAQVVKCG
jgi:hypothetical protein